MIALSRILSALTAADLLGLAAAPAFASMAFATQVIGANRPDIICSMSHNASPITGMVPMYVLMSVFHLPPWLKIIANRIRRRGPADRENSAAAVLCGALVDDGTGRR